MTKMMKIKEATWWNIGPLSEWYGFWKWL